MPTPYNLIDFPASTDAPDGPGGIFTAASQLDGRIGIGGAEYAANLAAINAIPTARCFEGKLAYAADTKYLYRYMTVNGAAPAWTLWDMGGTWTAFTLASGFTAQTAGNGMAPRWTVRSGILHVQGNVLGTFVSGTYTTVCTNAAPPPAAYRPTTNPLQGGGFGQSGRPIGWQYNTDGAIQVNWNNGGTAYTAPAWAAWSFQVPAGS